MGGGYEGGWKKVVAVVLVYGSYWILVVSYNSDGLVGRWWRVHS